MRSRVYYQQVEWVPVIFITRVKILINVSGTCRIYIDVFRQFATRGKILFAPLFFWLKKNDLQLDKHKKKKKSSKKLFWLSGPICSDWPLKYIPADLEYLAHGLNNILASRTFFSGTFSSDQTGKKNQKEKVINNF